MGVVLPEGEYRGRLIRDDKGKLIDVMLIIPRRLADQLGLDRDGTAPLLWSIIGDYRSGLIREDR